MHTLRLLFPGENMSTHILRSYLYLDSDIVRDYLAGLGLLADTESIKEVSENTGGLSGGLGISPVKIEGKKESKRTIESTRQLTHNDAIRFQQLYKYLEDENALPYHEVMDAATWSEIRRNDFLEVAIDLALPKLTGLMDSMGIFSQLATTIGQAVGNMPLNQEQERLVTALQGLGQLDPGVGLAISMLFAGSPEYALISHLVPGFIKVDKSRLSGQATILCRVQRKLRDDEQYELANLMHTMERFAINDEVRGALEKFKGELPKEARETIGAPAAIVTPIAIYK